MSPSDYKSLLKETLLAVLRGINNGDSHLHSRIVDNNQTPEDLRELLVNILIASNNVHWKEDTLSLIDRVWEADSDESRRPHRHEDRVVVPIEDVPVLFRINGTEISLWRGDITKLEGEDLAIVNAANEQGLGCFVPHHKCIDNIIHRAAGPRLRMECHQVMQQRQLERTNNSKLLSAGTEPILTSAYNFLPSGHVIHVTGPQVSSSRHGGGGSRPTRLHREQLSKAYEYSLDLAAAAAAASAGSSTTQGTGRIQSIAFPCISTGLFGFPQEEAAEIAISSVISWLLTRKERNLDGGLKKIVFDVFTEKDLALYRNDLAVVQSLYADSDNNNNNASGADNGLEEQKNQHWKEDDYNEEDCTTTAENKRQKMIDLAKEWIDRADAVLICAGAGMSVKEGEMVYTNEKDFAEAYPFFANKWGYKTSYECMSLPADQSVPENAKWGLYAKHMDNMRWKFTPNQGYDQLLQLVQNKDYFVLTSNVDACFERSGFDPNRIYTPQGEWTYLQCMNACQEDSVFESRPYIDRILPHISKNNGLVPKELVPKCPRCGSNMFGNVRGGGWYLHTKYEAQNIAIQQWMQERINDLGSNVVVLEIGAGFNTPTVTRFPVESFARELGDRARFVRINPTEAAVPEDIKAMAIEEGWQVLEEIGESQGLGANNKNKNKNNNNQTKSPAMVAKEERDVQKILAEADLIMPNHFTMRYRRHFRHFDWRKFLDQLRDN